METIDDIVREMREGNPPCNYHKNNGESLDYEEMVMMFADRIEEALKRKDEATHSQWERAMTLDAENARLRAALKPVLSVKVSEDDAIATAYSCMDACRKSMRIWREGMEERK